MNFTKGEKVLDLKGRLVEIEDVETVYWTKVQGEWIMHFESELKRPTLKEMNS
jgi:hypothetical protein